MNFLENDSFEKIKNLLQSDNVFLVIDKNIAKLYPKLAVAKNKCIFIAKEENKSFETAQTIIQKMFKKNCNRQTQVVAIGGGLTSDVAGFVASIYMRGVDWVVVPTTLLSMVDASIGGKTGVNFEGFKNTIGTFHSPKGMIVSLEFLKTLPENEMFSGVGEIVKTMFLDEESFEFLEQNFKKLVEFDEGVLSEMINKCVKIKEKIVKIDPFEKNEIRKILNIGHTIGHAIETSSDFKTSHGECVLFGMLVESTILKKYYPIEKHLPKITLLKKILKGRRIKLEPKEIVNISKKDKKNSQEKISIYSSLDFNNSKEYLFLENELLENLEKAKIELAEFIC
ncbi:MAG: 3-dehydroquinate synthase [Firmicutes bacterium]|nr:3-dehydroquinate synthase [Bacillota bacterium]MCL2256176.1 3-dehydroquinate synthase [Bacillota bacterium]